MRRSRLDVTWGVTWVEPAAGVRLWAEQIDGPPGADPVLLLADADASALSWPPSLLAALARRGPVVRFDHRDTGLSTRSAEEPEYGVADLTADALAVLDAVGRPRARLLGFGLGGVLAQLLLLDAPERVVSATLLGCPPLPGAGVPELPPPDEAVRRFLAEIDDPRDDAGELAWRVALRRLLHGSAMPFDAAAARAAEERMIAHAGSPEPSAAHRRLDPPPARGDELAGVRTPVIVVEGPHDPVHPPPHAPVLAGLLRADLVGVPDLGHAVPDALAPLLAAAVHRDG
jgi:pimeloyl-ACP methyl ester carboxylesterase